MLIPVLAVADIEAARKDLTRHFGFAKAGRRQVALGEQKVHLVKIGESMSGLIPLRLDHVAFAVADADDAYRDYAARGATLDTSFTPDGPRDIPQFWKAGVRFVFFKGPDGAPFEFCAINGETSSLSSVTHGHYAIRAADTAEAKKALIGKGARPVADYLLPDKAGDVSVSFLTLDDALLEIFDEPRSDCVVTEGGWIGVAQDG